MKFKDFVYPMDENLDFVHRYPLDEIIILSKNYDMSKIYLKDINNHEHMLLGAKTFHLHLCIPFQLWQVIRRTSFLYKKINIVYQIAFLANTTYKT